MAENVDMIIAIMGGLVVIIPLIISLAKYIKTAVKNKNWNALVTIVINLISEAEDKFETGADRKEWVLSMIESMSDSIDYDIDIEQVSGLIDALCAMAKIVNISKK